MPHRLYRSTGLALVALLAGQVATAAMMSDADYTVARERIDMENKANVAACGTTAGNTLDICLAEASGKQQVLIAELAYRRSSNPDDAARLAEARADANRGVARARCAGQADKARESCAAEAEAVHTKALIEAALTEKRGDAGENAEYDIAAGKCADQASGDQAACISAAKVRFSKQ